jgi:4-hydroxythreonine-4-phosphate dehydrogenase
VAQAHANSAGSHAGTSRLPLIAVTSGEPAGIGPDICLALAAQRFEAQVVVLGDRGLLRERAARLGLPVRLRDWPPGPDASNSVLDPGTLQVLHVPLAAPSVAGKLDPANSPYVLALIETAVRACLDGRMDAIATAPVHKGVINDAGIPFMGHTEFLAEKTGTPQVVMMLAGAGLRVALASTHLALKEVPAFLSQEGLERTIRILCSDLESHFGIAAPRILVAGLNPHSGEGGHFGREEIEVIEPVLRKLQAEGFRLKGPLPADTLFTPQHLSQADAVLAMYHDQGLPVLKFASFGQGINITLGLPLIRTSVDHGTALDLAGSGKAEAGSLIEAVQAAIAMVAAKNGLAAL